MSSIRLSVIIPGFNNPIAWWCRCIDSVLTRIGPTDEIICVDDGSGKTPIEIRERYSSECRLRFKFCEVNRGLPSARNVGLELARGRYVAFIDSDDELCGEAYETAIDKLEQSGTDICVFGVRSLWISERLFRDNEAPSALSGVMTAEMFQVLYSNRILNYAWNKVFPRQFLTETCIRFDQKGVPCEDIIFILACIEKGAKWTAIPGIGIVYYRTHGTLLSRYKRTYLEGTRECNRALEMCARVMRSNVPLNLEYTSEDDIMKGEWDNIWRTGSPYSLRARYRFLRTHPNVCGGKTVRCFLKMLIFKALRAMFYTSSVQRWHIRRIYPDAKSL